MSDVTTILLYAEIPLIVVAIVLLIIMIVQQCKANRANQSAAEAPVQQPAAQAPVAQAAPQPVQPVQEAAAQPVEETAVAEEPVEDVAEEVAEEPEAEEEDIPVPAAGANSVMFERGSTKKTWTEKYDELEEEQRKMLDEVFAHVVGEAGVRRLDLTANVRVKYKTHELFKADIKRGVPVLNFMLSNTSLMRYVKESGTKKIKITPVTVKLNDNDDLQLALRTADMALEQAKSEEEYKKAKRKEQRREREQAKRAQ